MSGAPKVAESAVTISRPVRKMQALPCWQGCRGLAETDHLMTGHGKRLSRGAKEAVKAAAGSSRRREGTGGNGLRCYVICRLEFFRQNGLCAVIGG